MNINITITEILKDKLSLMSKIYSSNRKDEKYPMAIKFDEKGMLHAINTSVSLSYKLGSDEVGLIPSLPEKPFLLPDGAVKLLLATSLGTEVIIEVEKSVIGIKTSKKKTSARFAGLSVNTFPEIEAIDRSDLIVSQISSEYIERAIKATLFSVSSNNAKPIYTGLHFIAKSSQLTCFSCDGYTSAIHQTKTDNAEFTISIPKDTIGLIQSCLKSADENISLGVMTGGRKAVFILDSQTVLRTVLLTGELMDYKQFFKDKKYSFDVDSNELNNILKRMLVINDNSAMTPMTVLEISEKELILSYKGVKSEYVDQLEIEHGKFPEETVRIAFNINFLSDCIKAIGSKKIRIGYDGPLAPALIKGTDVESPQGIIVPMRLTN